VLAGALAYTRPMRWEVGGVVLATAMALACGRLKPAAAPDAGTPSSPTVDATPTVPDADEGGASTADAIEAPGGPPDTTVPPTGQALPSGVPPPARFADGSAILMGNGKNACTHQTPASGNGHRWCAFTLGAAMNGVADLWVLDVTRAATGDVPPCDGTDAGCLHLTDKVVTTSATFFSGDTLFYGTDSTAAPGADFLGRIFAWRPGWSGGRQVSSDAGCTCIGNVHSSAAACLDDPAGDPTKRDSVNVGAGYLTSQTGGVLPMFGRYPLRNDTYIAWQAALSPDGTIFVLSDADTIGAPQTLRIAPTDAIGQAPPTLALDDVASWQISNDGQRIYFMRGPSQTPDLYVADFPSGANATLVETTVKSFIFIGDSPADRAVEIAKIRQVGGAIELLSDPTATAPKTIFTYDDFLNGAVVSPDLRYTTWLNENFTGVVFRNSDLGTCDLAPGREVYDPSYLDGASLMFFTERRQDLPNSDLRDGYSAPPESCGDAVRFARNVDRIAPIGDLGLVFTDELDPTANGTLKYIAVAPGGAALDPAGAVRVHENVAAPVVLVGENPPLLVYAAKGPTADKTGLYVFGPVPF
jgi:hypothetical protein